ncbi:MAG: N-acetylmuramoyl-L-alanine amidase [Planctomycetes bacterium]|nr:N-acetylmuramoyl-L-alanine amidase [Planctomycetota bacterium]
MRTALFLALFGCQSAPDRPVRDERDSEIRRYVRRLESKNASVCLDAVDYLPYFGADAVPALVEELHCPNANGRALAAATLARIPDGRAVEPLIALLDDKGTLELNVLSDDGGSLHGAYDNPLPNFVRDQALFALRSITGQRFSSRADWTKWWGGSGTAFEPRPRAAERRRLPDRAKFLRGLRVCIDPGHGGDTHKRGYKRGPTYASEAEINLRVARFLRDDLVAAGATVTMTRDSDRDVPLETRAKAAEGHDFFLSIHHNWSPRLDALSTTTWYHLTPDHQPAAMDLARHVEKEVLRALDLDGSDGGGLMSDGLMYESGFGVLRQLPPDVPGCLCEMTYYSNLATERKLRDIEFNRREAWGLFLGIVEYASYGIPRAELVSNEGRMLKFRVYDGLEDRGAWAKPFKVFEELISVKLDGRAAPHEYDAKTGTITVKHDLAPGAHDAAVTLVNLHKNHSLPKRIRFEAK